MAFDVAVLGGGPAGSVCAARLAALGRSVLLLERDRHPRFHLGESLLPNTLTVLEALGLLSEVRERFMVKRGARFVSADASKVSRFAFADAFNRRWDHAFQVPRDEFDELLFRHAQACGADAREGWAARLASRAGGGTSVIEAIDAAGRTHAVEARIVVDATGRDALVARAQSASIERIPGLDRTAFYTQVRGAWRDAGEREGDIQIVVFGEGEMRSWFWLIPFADGRSSVGAVVPAAWVRAHKTLGGPDALFEAAVAEAPSLGQMLSGTTRLFAPRAVADFSFRVRSLRGDGWLALGDAAGFIDPLFSTGAHLAMTGALRAADGIHAALVDGDVSAGRFQAWEDEMRAGADLFVGAVQAFYSGALTTYLFAEPQHPFLRRAITSMLAGDVFDPSARWVREMRARFPSRLA